ncbi:MULTISPECIES: 50S ribosomal protein L7/L12 [unclassified Coleofasciculus]|uniref:50S ribosomal protein L7/L12 n=1 Tax=unclassified Coleofasciculus TaxID=2692782 RepID=UPI00187F3671|nr:MULTISPECIES: 50S ribosomal protein L7/L12 [unclassified Coleofasciculus]MBE9127513.1 50S ribosomal protein L7/L12 [Coleofasciculus sp. LEGE 07081]MBE9150825.1 50S ribosomal protein L7/L12 [Coleofasciculus sp. LEGE 07092]
MSVKTIEILEKLKSLTLIETSELVKQVEVTFGVNASPQKFIGVEINQDNLPPPPPPKPTEFNVILEEVPTDKKIAILKVVRTLTGLGLKEAKDFVESAPRTVQEAIAPEAAEEIKQQLELAGAKVSLQ